MRSPAPSSPRLSDNPFLGPEYRAQLLALDPVTRAQLLEGDWDAAVGRARCSTATGGRGSTAAPRRRASPVPGVGLRRGRRRYRGVLLGDLGYGAHPRWVVLDVLTHRGPPHEVHALVKATAERDGHKTTVVVPQDPGQAGWTKPIPSRANSLGTTCAVAAPSATSSRARPWSAQVGSRAVALMRSPWAHAFVAEHHSFPDGSHDDQVDAAADAFAVLAGGVQGGDGGIFGAVTHLTRTITGWSDADGDDE